MSAESGVRPVCGQVKTKRKRTTERQHLMMDPVVRTRLAPFENDNDAFIIEITWEKRESSQNQDNRSLQEPSLCHSKCDDKSSRNEEVILAYFNLNIL